MIRQTVSHADVTARLQLPKGGRTVFSLDNSIAQMFHPLAGQTADARIVFDQQNGFALCHPDIIMQRHGGAVWPNPLRLDRGKIQAKTRDFARFLGVEERLEQVFDHLGRHARPGVADRQHDMVAGAKRYGGIHFTHRHILRAYRQITLARHRIAGIADLRLIGLHQIEIRRRLCPDPDLRPKCALQQRPNIFDRPVQIQFCRGMRLFLGKQQQARDQRRTKVCRLHRLGQNGVVVQIVGAHFQQFDIADGLRQQVVEIMCDSARQSADVLHPLGLLQQLARVLFLDRIPDDPHKLPFAIDLDLCQRQIHRHRTARLVLGPNSRPVPMDLASLVSR